MIQVPASVKLLKDQANFFAEFYNAPNEDIQLVHPKEMSWQDFADLWVQLCREQ
jgi:hypothetical protein